MRTENDIVAVQATISRRLTLDLERMELDPAWVQISESYNAQSGPDAFQLAVRAYLQYYIVRDQFPHQMPATNGPGDIDEVKLEVKWHQQQQ